jgi:peptidoglycan/xylan/chitin deacetylase (PgdA/CDA1 family)
MQDAALAVRLAAGRVFKPVWHYGGLVNLTRMLAGRRGAILRYHSVTDDEATTLSYLDHGLMVTGEAFSVQLRYLRRFYNVLSLDEMVDRLHRGHSLPPRSVAITFDDGYRDNYTQAYPLLRAEGLPATFYVTTGCIDGGPPLWTAKLRFMVRRSPREHVTFPEVLGAPAALRTAADRQAVFTRLVVSLKNIPSPQRRDLVDALGERFGVTDFTDLASIMMSWDDLREMHRNGMTIGAHTVTHPNLPNTDPEEATAEIMGSRDMIAGQLRTPVTHFSYPNGRGSAHLTDTVRDIVRQLAFRSAVTSVPGCVETRADPWALRRVGVYNRHRHIPSFSLDVERARLRPSR